MKLVAEPIVAALHRANNSLRFNLSLEDFTIIRNETKLIPISFDIEGYDLVVVYDEKLHINDKLPE